MKLGIDIQHVSGHCWKGFQGQRSNVKVTARPNAHFLRRCGMEAHLQAFI